MDALYKKSHWFEGIQDKSHQAAAARDDGAKRAINAFIKHIHLNGLT